MKKYDSENNLIGYERKIDVSGNIKGKKGFNNLNEAIRNLIESGERLENHSRSLQRSFHVLKADLEDLWKWNLNDYKKMSPEEIEQIYISVGPGSFTGLRIAVTLAKTMHLASAAKIVAVDTLDVIAANINDYIKEQTNGFPEKIATIIDAKRGQFFIAVYQRNSKDTEQTEKNASGKKFFPTL